MELDGMENGTAILPNDTESSVSRVALAGVEKAYLLPRENPLHVPPHVVLSRIDDEVARLKKEVKQLRFRNYEKDKGKKFEGSYTRIFFIMVHAIFISFSSDLNMPTDYYILYLGWIHVLDTCSAASSKCNSPHCWVQHFHMVAPYPQENLDGEL